MKNITKKWIALSNYDLKSADFMLSSRRYLYVAFMCQQALEKLFKAIIAEKTDTPPPYTHNLNVLVELSGAELKEEEAELLSLLTRHYINTRYPALKEALTKTLNMKTAKELLNRTKGIARCLKKELTT